MENQDTDCVRWFAQILGRLLYTNLHPLLEADKVSGQSWQLVTDICDEGEGLTLCEFSQGYDSSHFCVTFKVLWRFLWNLIDIIGILHIYK
jgi:hypothetical protein